MYIHSVLTFALLEIVASCCASKIGREEANTGGLASASRTVPLVNIKPPLPILNGSTYSQHAPTGTKPRLLNTGATSAAAASTSNLATYSGHTFPTLCRGGDTACLTTCKSFADSCSADFNSWTALRREYQSSMADKENGGSMPLTTKLHIQTEKATTVWRYETSWYEYVLTTQVEGWGAGSLGMTTTVLTDSEGDLSTSTYYKTGLLNITYTSSIPIAVGGTGTPVSTSEAHYNTFTFEQTSWYDYAVPRPTCSPSSWTDCRYSSDCNKCTISGGTVQLLYFPVPRTEGASEATSFTPSPTALETAVYKNVTLTSPSVYISFQTAYAQNDCGTQVGKRYPGAILPLPLSDLSSVYGGYGTLYSSDPLAPLGAVSNTPYLAAGQFHLADLNWPPPMSAYTNQLKFALGREIFSIMTKPYNPHLAVPSQVRNLDPAWASCGLDWEGLYDPPSALQPAKAEAKPTMSAQTEVYTSAMPQSSASSMPEKTSTSKATAFFTGPASVDESRASKSMPAQETGSRPTKDPQGLLTTEEAAHPDADPTGASKIANGGPEEQVSRSVAFSVINTQVTPGSTEAAVVAGQDPTASKTTLNSAEADPISAGSMETRLDPSTVVSLADDPSSVEGTGDPATTSTRTAQGVVSDRIATKSSLDPKSGGNAPLVVAIGSQTVTAGGSEQTISNQVISLAPTEIFIGSSKIRIPLIEAGTQPISIPAGSSSALMGMTFIAGEVSAAPKLTTSPPATVTAVEGSILDSTALHAVFTFGTHTYTAVQTHGASEAVIGKSTLVEGEVVSLKGGRVSLVSGYLELDPDATSREHINRHTVTAVGAVVTLAHTTLSFARHRNGDLVLGSSTLSSDQSLVTLGWKTLSFGDGGVVIEGKKHTRTVMFQPTSFPRHPKSVVSNSTQSSDSVPLTTALVTYPSGELPGATTATSTSSSSANGFGPHQAVRFAIEVFFLSSAWHLLR